MQAQKAVSTGKAVLSTSRKQLSYTKDVEKFRQYMPDVPIKVFEKALRLFLADHPATPKTAGDRDAVTLENLPHTRKRQVRPAHAVRVKISAWARNIRRWS